MTRRLGSGAGAGRSCNRHRRSRKSLSSVCVCVCVNPGKLPRPFNPSHQSVRPGRSQIHEKEMLKVNKQTTMDTWMCCFPDFSPGFFVSLFFLLFFCYPCRNISPRLRFRKRSWRRRRLRRLRRHFWLRLGFLRLKGALSFPPNRPLGAQWFAGVPRWSNLPATDSDQNPIHQFFTTSKGCLIPA